MSDPTPVSVSVWVYQRLLNAYPREFRQEYGADMAQVFRDLCLRDGLTGLAGVWRRALLDYAVSLVSEYINRGAVMTRSKWIQLSGWGLIASGFLLLAGFAASSRPQYFPNSGVSWPIDPFLNKADLYFAAVGMLLISAGMLGLLARFWQRAGALGRAGLLIGVLAGGIGAAGAVGMGIVDSTPWWEMLMVGLFGINLALVLFGITCLRERLFARWNGLPLAVGAIFLVMMVLSMGLVQWPDAVVAGLFILLAVGLALVGYRLQSEAVEGLRAA